MENMESRKTWQKPEAGIEKQDSAFEEKDFNVMDQDAAEGANRYRFKHKYRYMSI